MFRQNGLPEIDIERELFCGHFGERLLNQIINILGNRADDGLRTEILHRGHAGNRAVIAGGGQQRNVIADGLIAVGTAQIENTRILHFRIAAFGQISFGGNDLHFLNVKGPVRRIVENNQVTNGHKRALL